MNVLAVFAHPDDEVLGCGGTLAKHSEAGDEVAICYGTSERRVERGEAARVLGISSVNVACFGLPDQEFELHPVSRMISLLRAWPFGPDVIYTHHPGDLNLDHALTARAVLTAFRPKPGEVCRTILACEVGSSTEWTFPATFSPNYFVELSREQLAKKIKAMECYPTEVNQLPHPRGAGGIINAAAYRGQQCGVTRAEAFQVLRIGPL